MHKIELSARMQMNADLVPQGASLADIGCDHGYVSIYLARENKCRNIIAMDVKEGPLAIARRNVESAGVQHKVSCRLSDGVMKLEPGEMDTLLIAGMGGMLVCRILQAKQEVLAGVSTLILQAQSDWYTLRKTIWRLGYRIDCESVCQDMGKYYLAIRAIQGEEETPYTEEECTYGKLLPKSKNETYLQWLLREKEKKESVCKHLQEKDTEEARKRMEELQKELQTIQWVQKKYYGG